MSRTDDILDGAREPIWKTPVCDEELAKIQENYKKLQAENERQKTAIQIAQEYIRGESGACNINNAVRILLSMDEILKGE